MLESGIHEQTCSNAHEVQACQQYRSTLYHTVCKGNVLLELLSSKQVSTRTGQLSMLTPLTILLHVFWRYGHVVIEKGLTGWFGWFIHIRQSYPFLSFFLALLK